MRNKESNCHSNKCNIWSPAPKGARHQDELAYFELESELFLRPTVSRPVRLGIGPPFGALDQILSYSSFFV
jgi:hypothetical protein